MKKEEVVTRQQLNQLHIGDLLSLATIVGWDYDREEIQTLLASGSVYGHVNIDKMVISCAAIIPYGAKLASIGMVIVHPDYRGRGLAKELLIQCMSQVTQNTALMLIATKEGRPVYEKLGFKLNNYIYYQLPLKNGGSKMEMKLMSYPKKLNNAQFEKVEKEIQKEVYPKF